MKNRLGIVGGGQLGRMLAFEAKKMGFHVMVVDPTQESPAGQVVDTQITAHYKDEIAIRKLAEGVDIITFEIESANDKVLEELMKEGKKVHPSPRTLSIIRDKYQQKKFLSKHKIPVADFFEVNTLEDIVLAGKKFGYPFLLKAKTDAYDGRGNVLIKKKSDIKKGIEKLKGRELYVEKFVPFVKELAIQVARSTRGEIKAYPVVETIHKNNICHTVMAPAEIDGKIKKRATNLSKKVMENLKGAGVFGIEMFLDKNGQVFINEIAPRVHNSGHYTIEANVTSQFEQHVRAVAGLPLGETTMKTKAAMMINILGNRNGRVDIKGMEKALKLSNISIHIYGKKETKIERKMGHITVIGESSKEVKRKAVLARKYINI